MTDPLSYDELQEAILFKVNGRCGYPLHDALKRCYTGLDGRDDTMFRGFKSSISIRLEVRLISVIRSKRSSLIFFCSGCHTKSGRGRLAHCVAAHYTDAYVSYRFER